jgi:hypothetical protein
MLIFASLPPAAGVKPSAEKEKRNKKLDLFIVKSFVYFSLQKANTSKAFKKPVLRGWTMLRSLSIKTRNFTHMETAKKQFEIDERDQKSCW